jgi:hypothetical protein
MLTWPANIKTRQLHLSYYPTPMKILNAMRRASTIWGTGCPYASSSAVTCGAKVASGGPGYI